MTISEIKAEAKDNKIPLVLFEDEDLIVLDKPAGLHSVKQSKSLEPSLAQWLLEFRPQQESIGKNTGDAGLVQRLDFETSGLILAAKNNQIWEHLHELILAGQVKKSYHCLAEGIFKAEQQQVNSYIGSPYRRAQKVRVYKKPPVKPHRALAAETIFSPVSVNKQNNVSLLKVQAHSARRHQIRAHAASINHPLLGDSLYGSNSTLQVNYAAAFYLQASLLNFIHPKTGKQLEFRLNIPQEIEQLLRSHQRT